MTTTHETDQPDLAVLAGVRGMLDALSVKRVFADPYTVEGVTIIPVARIVGGAGGGGGEGQGPGDEGGHGFGTGLGFGARPVGVYEVRDGRLEWRPSIDVDRLIRGCQVVAAIATVGATLVRLRSRRSS